MILALGILPLALGSCANTTAGPSGGDKDTIPPVLLTTVPDVNQVNVSTQIKRVELQFDEYVKLHEPNDNILLSPPPEKKLSFRTKGKGIVVDLPEALQPGTTYNLYFGDAIQDNNEGNPFPVFALSFSTGPTLDSLMFSGMVADASTLLPVPHATVLLHLNPTDTTLTSTLPVAVTRTDAYGYFVLRNLKDTLYSLYAITDQNNNHRYDRQQGEQVGFSDSLIRPTKVMFPYAPEIQPYFAKDTAGLLKRPLETNVFLFTEVPVRQVLSQYERTRPKTLQLVFSAPNVNILRTHIPGLDSTDIVQQHNYRRDSILLWLKAADVPDTVRLHLTYMATVDSLKILKPRTDTLRFLPFKEEKADQSTAKLENAGRGRADRQQAPPSAKKEENYVELKTAVTPETVREKGFSLLFKDLPTDLDFSHAQLLHTTASGDTVQDTYKVLRDSLNFCVYRIIPKSLKEGTSYKFKMPAGIFTDIYGFKNDSLTVSFKTLLSEEFCALHLQLEQVASPLIIDLMTEKRDRIHRTLRAKTDTIVTFPYLKPGKYTIRITEDLNDNGFWDTGDVLARRQPERVRVFKLPSGSSVIELKDKMEVTQIINVENLLNQNVTLTVPARRR
jgi:hypothetical protein